MACLFCNVRVSRLPVFLAGESSSCSVKPETGEEGGSFEIGIRRVSACWRVRVYCYHLFLFRVLS